MARSIGTTRSAGYWNIYLARACARGCARAVNGVIFHPRFASRAGRQGRSRPSSCSEVEANADTAVEIEHQVIVAIVGEEVEGERDLAVDLERRAPEAQPDLERHAHREADIVLGDTEDR